MMMKKLISFAAILLALACMLSGCSGDLPFEGVPNPIATITLTDGTSMRFELFLQDAPNTVANFVELAQSGFYDGLKFFRVVPGALIQSGDPKNSGITNNISHTRGTISMARQSDYDTASSQFFIMQGNYPEYNGQYAAFGRATDEASLAAIDKIASTIVDSEYYPVGSVPKIASITVETHNYEYKAEKFDLPEDKEE